MNGDFSSESALNINKLSSTLACCVVDNSLNDTLITCVTRALIYPLYRNFDFAI